MVATLYFASTFIDTAPVPAAVRWALWAVYWYFQGAVATGVWVIGHECGHQVRFIMYFLEPRSSYMSTPSFRWY